MDGIISPVTFIISLFSETIAVFEPRNNGNWYVFGFLIGTSIIFGGGCGGAVASKCKKNRLYRGLIFNKNSLNRSKT